MEIKRIDFEFSVCKVEDYSLVKMDSEYCFVGKTDEENSLVCITDYILTKRENYEKALAVLADAGYQIV